MRFEIPVSNLIAFSANNGSVITGNNKKKGVVAFLRKYQLTLITISYRCYVSLSAEKAAAVSPSNSKKI